jgi:hypothetical protein
MRHQSASAFDSGHVRRPPVRSPTTMQPPIEEPSCDELRVRSHILVKVRETKGAVALRCRWLDGRAAILMVVARSEGSALPGIGGLCVPSCSVVVYRHHVPTPCGSRRTVSGIGHVLSA